MKRILSVLLVLVMVLSMIPVIASAAETEVLFELGANGSAGHYDGTEKTTYSETVNGNTLSITGGTKMYTGARDAKGNSCIKLGTSSKAGSFSFTVPDDVTSVIINVAAYKAKTATVTVNGTKTTLTTKSDNGAYDAITVDTTSTKTVSFAVTSGYRAMVNSIKFTVSSSGEGEETCEHTDAHDTEAVAATCTEVGYTAGRWCPDCETYIEGHEQLPVLPHTETVTEEQAATCTEDGYTKYTCSVCNASRTERIDATGHNYVDGMCSVCGLELPDDLSGKYYIAARYNADGSHYWYMTNDVGTASTLRYQIVDSGVTTLPESIVNVVETQLFELVAVDGGYVIKTGEQYLGYTSGNSGALVALDDAKVVTIEYSSTEGAYNIHFTVSAEDERYLALNNAADSPWYAWYKGAGNQIQDLYLVPVAENAEVCEHANATTEGDVKATCTTEGATGATVCPDCGVTIQANEVIPALGHDYVDGICSVCGAEKPVTPTTGKIDFATTTQRVSQDANSQVWSDGVALTVTNNKASSTSNIIDSSNPVRFYKSSDVVIEFPGMTKIVVVCNNTTYATALKNSVKDATVSADGTTITIELAKAADSFTISLTGGQVRVNSMTVYASKVCNHVWGEPVLTTDPACAVEGENTITCTLCGESKKEPVAAVGHVAADGFCSVCGGEFYTLATSLNEGDSVVLYNPENEVVMGVKVNSYGDKLLPVASDDATGLAVIDGMAVMQVQYVNETDFYLVKDGKYLTTGATGNSLVFADEANDYSIWYLEVPFEGDDVVLITNRNAVYKDNTQSIEYYNSAFTTYSRSTGKAYQMKLYVKAAPVPSVEITHISLNPAKDALGYKAEAQNLPEGAHVEISLWVNENIVVTKATAALRLVNIMACNGGEMTINAKATIVDGEGKVIAESAVEQTTMKETVETVNALTNLTSEQKAAVYDLYEQYSDIMDAWLGENNNIKTWAPVEE